MAQSSLNRPWAAGSWGGPFDQLRRELDSVFNRFGSGPLATGTWQGVFPAVNLYETPDAYVLTTELPGVEPKDVQLTLEGSTVSLQGERKVDPATPEGASFHRRERQAGSFRRAFELPGRIDGEKVEAIHRNGVLVVRLPKTPEHQPRQITVQAR